MPLRYDPADVLGWVPRRGEYSFRVLSCAETTFSTGAEGVRLHLDVDVEGRTLTCWDNIVFGRRSLWKMYDLCMATEVRFDPPPDADEFRGRRGRARFETREHRGFVDLIVAKYLHNKPLPAQPPVDG